MERNDLAARKRIELHARTNYAGVMGLPSASDYAARMSDWGHKAIAFTDPNETRCFPYVRKAFMESGIQPIYGTELTLSAHADIVRHYHVMVLSKNREGIVTINQMITQGYSNWQNDSDGLFCVDRTELETRRNNLLVGSSCNEGEVVNALRNGKTDNEILSIMEFYDYIEVQPMQNEQKRFDRHEEDYCSEIRRTIRLAQMAGKPVVAVSNASFLDPEESMALTIIRADKRLEEDTCKHMCLRTTNEMLAAFAFLPEEVQTEIVIDAPNRIAEAISCYEILPDCDNVRKYKPVLLDAKKNLCRIAEQRAREIYGDSFDCNRIPDDIRERMDREFDMIEKQGCWTDFEIVRLLIDDMNKAGFSSVGYRECLGSSFVLWLCGLGEANPLPAHYVCPDCHKLVFPEVSFTMMGPDLPDMSCPRCSSRMNKDGFNILPDNLFGREGENNYDIELNVPEGYLRREYDFLTGLLGEEHVAYAGTANIDRYDDPIYRYLMEHDIHINEKERGHWYDLLLKNHNKTEIEDDCRQVICISADYRLNDFFAIKQFTDSDGKLRKFVDGDMVHCKPLFLRIVLEQNRMTTVMQKLSQSTRIKLEDVPLNDQDTMSLFSGHRESKVKDNELADQGRTCGISEPWSSEARDLLEVLSPEKLSELTQILGTVYGARRPNEIGDPKYVELIYARPTNLDNLYFDLVGHGVSEDIAYDIMESVYKRKKVPERHTDVLREHGIPEEYIQYCEGVMCMYPKAHIVQLIISSMRTAWYRVHYPAEFFAAWEDASPAEYADYDG